MGFPLRHSGVLRCQSGVDLPPETRPTTSAAGIMRAIATALQGRDAEIGEGSCSRRALRSTLTRQRTDTPSQAVDLSGLLQAWGRGDVGPRDRLTPLV